MTIFFAYRGSVAFPAVYKREIVTQKLIKQNADTAKLEALLANINSKALGRIFLDSLDEARYDELKARIENSLVEGTNIYPLDVADKLTRAQNYIVPKKLFVWDRDTITFITAIGANGGGLNDHGRGHGGHMNRDGAKTCYQCNGPHIIGDCTHPPSSDDAFAITS